MGLEDLLKLAYGGASVKAYLLLSVLTFGAHRIAAVSQTWVFAAAAAVGAALGALGGYTEALSTVGVEPAVLYHATVAGAIMGAGSCVLVGWGASKALDASGLVPVSEEKRTAEAIRNPMDPTQPPAR